WYQKPSFADFLARVREAKKCGFAVDRGAMFQGITLVSVPVLSPSWELVLILTAAGHSHDLDAKALGALSRALQSAAARLSESARYLNHVADKFDLRRDIQFKSRVTAAHYQDDTRSWDVILDDGRRYTTRLLITAIGVLSAATMPRISGVETFQGQSCHTHYW